MLPTSPRTSSPSWRATATATATRSRTGPTDSLLLLLLPTECNPTTSFTIRGPRTRMWALDAAFLLPEEVVESYNSNNLVCVSLSVVVARRPSEVRSSPRWGRPGVRDVSFAPWTSASGPSKRSDLSRKKVNFIAKTAMAVTWHPTVASAGKRLLGTA